MTGEELLARVKRDVEESHWLDDTGFDFHDIYLHKPDIHFPLGVPDSEDLFLQMRRKFYYPFNAIAEALEDKAKELGNFPDNLSILPVIDADYEYSTSVFLIWCSRNAVIVKSWRNIRYFWFSTEQAMAEFLEEKYLEGVSRLEEIAGKG